MAFRAQFSACACRRLRAAAVVGALLGWSPVALAQGDLIRSAEPGPIAEIARAYGDVEGRTTEGGAPFLVGTIDGVRYGILFYGCDNGRNCRRIQLVASFGDFSGGVADMNAWNVDRVIGRAYLAENGDAVLDHVVNIEHGVTRENLDRTFEWWSIVLADFVEFLVERN